MNYWLVLFIILICFGIVAIHKLGKIQRELKQITFFLKEDFRTHGDKDHVRWFFGSPDLDEKDLDGEEKELQASRSHTP